MSDIINVSGAASTATPLTKQTAGIIAQSILLSVSEGNMHAGEALAVCKVLAEACKAIEAELKPNAQEWAGRGASLKLGETVQYSYANTPAWVSAKTLLEQIQAEAQRLQKIGLAEGCIVDADGVAHAVKPAIRSASNKVTITLEKK